MEWSKKAWHAMLPVLERIVASPFIQELMSGKLDKEKFAFYIQQDALYLADYGKVLTGIASKLENPAHTASFIGFANDSIAVEKALHETFIHQIEAKDRIQASPSCLLYTSYLMRQFANAPIEVAVAAVLPCFWIYKEVGDYILTHQTKESNPYQSWIDTYGGEDFAKAVKTAISITDELAKACTEKQQQTMLDSFVICSKMEYLFWESAYKQEKWSV